MQLSLEHCLMDGHTNIELQSEPKIPEMEFGVCKVISVLLWVRNLVEMTKPQGHLSCIAATKEFLILDNLVHYTGMVLLSLL